MGLPTIAVLFLTTSLLARTLYRLYIHPLARVPGPKLAAATSLWLAYHTYIGDECSTLFALHKKYGPVLRIAPNDIDIASGDAIEPIYLARGGFPKTPVYSKFDIDGHSTIFSSLNLPERASRAKAVAPLFSTASIRNARGTLLGVVDDFVERVRRDAIASLNSNDGNGNGKPVNVLALGRAMAIDAVSAYLFQERYGALKESEEVMSASPFVDAYVGVGAFFNFDSLGRAGEILVSLFEYFTQPAGTAKSFTTIDDYTSRLIRQAVPKSGSYQSRLLERVSSAQSQVEVKDVCFAGTDSTGMNTATIIWYLVKCPEIYDRLRTALQTASPDTDPLSTPYLRAVVREGLRLSWANPIRLPRAVPTGGWKYKSYFFPPGTSVGVSAWQLHQDETVFPDPLSFKPERWLEPNVTEEMLNNWFAFGKGTRACIAQNLGLAEVTMATWKVAESGVLQGAKVVDSEIGILEWFNSRVKGEEILIKWVDAGFR
ncbi:cytochrome P450 [Aspergillus mulundensis]|uniref:Putative Cytochrome P450 n=1 Tax=Aspergillus mulundensis TaxID=1810919 RepID=A0A3D8S4Z9_9EURO|nr:putative Cytochrome P450 [Aspergillus mulundensis]RDW81377.1 putative Cytochrome P450 [Aspergillus mulundensis]